MISHGELFHVTRYLTKCNKSKLIIKNCLAECKGDLAKGLEENNSTLSNIIGLNLLSILHFRAFPFFTVPLMTAIVQGLLKMLSRVRTNKHRFGNNFHLFCLL